MSSRGKWKGERKADLELASSLPPDSPADGPPRTDRLESAAASIYIGLVKFLNVGPHGSERRLLLAHGAGAPMDSTFMNVIAEGVAAAGILVGRFEFPYMAQRRESGKRRGPDRAPVLMDCFREAVAEFAAGGPLFVGGKSMGGRIASMIADEVEAAGLVCLGYPFHPPGQPNKLRTEHLRGLRTPTLILQGSRDPFGTAEELESFALSPRIRVHLLVDGDHSFKPRKRSGRTEAQALAEAVAEIVTLIESSHP